MKLKLVIVSLFIASCAFAQLDIPPARRLARDKKDSTLILWKAGTKKDSVNVQSKIAAGILRFSVKNNSATDTLRIALCQSWADTTGWTDIEPTEIFNFVARDAGWVKFIAFAASDTILGRKIRFY